MTVKSTRGRKKAADADAPPNFNLPPEGELRNLITARAYEIFLMRNGSPGDELNDWVTAESEIISSLSAPKIQPKPVVERATLLPANKIKRSRVTKLAAAAKPQKRTASTTRTRKPKEKSE